MPRFASSAFAPLALLLLLTPPTLGCQRDSHAAEHVAAPRLTTTHPLRQDTTLNREFVAQIRAHQHIEVRALEKGYLQGVFVDEGQAVHAGARLFQVMPLLYQAEVLKAQAEAKLSEIELSNTRMLAEKKVVSANELALMDAKYKRSTAEVKLAKGHKQLTELRAPFDGIVGRFQVRLGSLVTEGDLLTTLSDTSKVWVYFNVSEAEYLKFKSQKPEDQQRTVRLITADGQLFPEPGQIEAIEADFNHETGNLAFRATFANPNALLRHGQTGKVVMSTQLPGALLIPQKATFNVLDQTFVYVVDEAGVVHARQVKLGPALPNLFVVESGLDERDQVLVDGLRKVRDGQSVTPDLKDPRELLQSLQVAAE